MKTSIKRDEHYLRFYMVFWDFYKTEAEDLGFCMV